MTGISPTVLRVGRLVDGIGAPPSDGVEVRIVAGRVDAVGPTGTVARPGDRRVERPDASLDRQSEPANLMTKPATPY